VIPNESTTHNHAEGEECTGDDGTTVVNGYYVVLFEGKDDNLTELVDVRHILVSFEGGTTDETTGTTTYSEDEKKVAENAAATILAAFQEGKQSEETFAELATKNTDDPGSKENGGLYENVYPGQMVSAFNDWCFDSARKAGDTGIVETEYGYHVMYFVGNSGMTYRDFMIESTLRNADLTAWETALIEGAELNVTNTKFIKTDLTLSSGK
jgi:sorbitol-specific phosphotransferase system component IIA